MENKLELLADTLMNVATNIKVGNSKLNEEQSLELLNMISHMTNPQEKYSKYQACKELHISRSTFDRYVKSGIIPKPRSQQGFKEVFWLKEDLDNAKNKINNR